jgi:hypothetical protein
MTRSPFVQAKSRLPAATMKGASGCDRTRLSAVVGDVLATEIGQIATIRHQQKFVRPEISRQNGAPVVPVSGASPLSPAAAYLGCSYWTLRDLVINGHIPAVRIRAMQ